MRNLLALLGAVVVTVICAGWYLDWFKVHRGSVNEGGSNYNVELNTKKIGHDLHEGEAKLEGLIEKRHGDLTPPSSVPVGLEEKSHYTPVSTDPNVSGPELLPPPAMPEPPK